MTDRELDAMVAEKVMGWKYHRCHERGKGATVYHFLPPGEYPPAWWHKPTEHPKPPDNKKHRVFEFDLPRYTTDPAADYAVLVKVRESWTPEQTGAFVDALIALWHYPTPIQYRPGDYSRAALAALSPNPAPAERE